jgi:thiol-disulfide isomerase/thioredoxin
MRRTFASTVGYLWLALVGFSFLGQSPAASAQTTSEGPPQMSPDPSVWLNGGPITADMLKGKAAFVYYFEEGCPRCRERWPALQAMAKKFDDKPIVFIAVNSGNPRETVARYVQDVKLAWPVLVDTSREFERQSNVNEISLQNIYQVRIIKPDGQMDPGSFSEPEESVNKALEGAKWNYDPTGIPASLFPLWRSLEFGMAPGPAGSLLKQGLASKDADTKAAAEKLNTLVQEKITEDMKVAKEAFAAGEKWKSYKLVDALATTYTGIELPESVTKAKTALAGDEEVKKQLQAQKELDALKKRARTATPAAMRGLIFKLKEIPEKYAGTDAAAEAEKLLAETPQGN